MILLRIFLGMYFIFRNVSESKYVEGTLKTNENWAFLARFCFLSQEGEFEYVIDYNEDQGDLNLLLYYDTEDQWPSVYKSNKTCEEKEAVLNIQQNQIVNLTARIPEAKEFAGCEFTPIVITTPTPLYTINIPKTNKWASKNKGTVKVKKVKVTPTTIKITTTEELQTTTFGTDISSSTPTSYDSSESTTTLSIAVNTTTQLNLDYPTTTMEDIILITEMTVDSTQSTVHPIKKRSVPAKQPVTNIVRRSRTVSCHNARRFKSSRERWWFIAISNCYGTKGININYQLLMTNGPSGDYWHEHFSADEFYILPILMAFSVAYSFLLLGITVCSLELKQRQLLHTTYKIFVLSCVLQLLGILVLSIVFLKVAVSGRISSRTKRVGNMMLGASETCFLLLLLLLAKGFTITRGRLSLKGTVKLTVFMCLYVTTYLTIFVYEAVVFDPGEVLYLYESPAGYGLIILRIIAWLMFIYSTVITLKKYPEKSNFYYPFNLFGTIWFVAGPAFIISANTYIDKWVRESVVWAVLLFIAFGGHLMFLILTMPSVANKNFPYHVRTSQIGIMETNGNVGNSTIEQFGHHVYEPSLNIREQTVIIPLTRRTEEICEGLYNQKRLSTPKITEMTDESSNEQARDMTIENVIKWSLAKNIPALDFPSFQQIKNKRDSIGSASSKLTDSTFNNDRSTRRPSLINHLSNENQNSPGNFEDYVNDVPIELFTISKIVTNTNGIPK
ncbi:transmembrane protein 145-like [Sitophilus oryzae]|uniref:Transmembrane protein 145-like n=1 Tax=Sitophilus oryzae TaxID=7048 RepID=A0A6J2X9Y4_SITOR|nr:transmembrane protein 145-like [Sitophilus oryzae]